MTGCLYHGVCLTKDCACKLSAHIEIDEVVYNNLKSEMEYELSLAYDDDYDDYEYDYEIEYPELTDEERERSEAIADEILRELEEIIMR